MGRRSKYPSLGILDDLYRLILGFHPDPSKNGLYESLPNPRPSKSRYSKMLYTLEHGEYIKRKGDTVSLTSKGKKKGRMRSLETILLSKVTDGAHRLIAFDIPEKMRYARDIIRSKLKAFECQQLQKSLYLTPYACEEEIREISRILGIERYVSVLKVDIHNFRIFNDREK